MHPSVSTQPLRQALFPRAPFDLVAIGASAGGVSALRNLLAPVDRHCPLALENGAMVSLSRPSADRLFTTAATQLGRRLLCVVLTGMGLDGAAGVVAVKEHGGYVIVQDPKSAEADRLHAIPNALISL